ncbi:hypothetical protein [Sporomusa ovata]|uniref:hypothetical protein n=1 Tax=Sporomusa ovata TaxID=2378 RepID=UPI001267F025|nr:hypothetical protein [Sporomusa ovata]
MKKCITIDITTVVAHRFCPCLARNECQICPAFLSHNGLKIGTSRQAPIFRPLWKFTLDDKMDQMVINKLFAALHRTQ